MFRQAAVAIALATVLSQMVEGSDDVRLTGLIAASERGRAFAVIEDEQGQQRLVREGERVGEKQVLSINPDTNSVRMATPNGDIVLRLTGSAFAEAYHEPYDPDSFMDNTEVRSIDLAVADSLRKLQEQAEAVPDEQLATLLNTTLGMPQNVRIEGVDDRQIDSARHLLSILVERTTPGEGRGGHIGTLSVADNKGYRRVYLMLD